MGKIISLVNQKGGIGKTITATSIAWILADRGYKVLYCGYLEKIRDFTKSTFFLG